MAEKEYIFYQHIKSGKVYRGWKEIPDKTSGREGQMLMLYFDGEESTEKLYAREVDNFKEKFKAVKIVPVILKEDANVRYRLLSFETEKAIHSYLKADKIPSSQYIYSGKVSLIPKITAEKVVDSISTSGQKVSYRSYPHGNIFKEKDVLESIKAASAFDYCLIYKEIPES